jgi:hypothetical protein
VTIGNNVTSIGDYTFHVCTSLTSVTIGSGITTIGDYAFYGCTGLTSITFLGLVAPTIGGVNWIQNTDSGIRGHAYADSNFPAQENTFNGLTMGTIIPVAPGAPGNLSAAPSNTQVILAWTAPASDGGSTIDYYVIYQDGVDVAHPTTLTATFADLTNGQIYSFTVAAHNSVGNGILSITKTVTPYTVPDSPTLTSATAGFLNITLAWTAPVNNGSRDITGYEIFYGTSVSNSIWTKFSTVGASVLNENVTGLTVGTTYYFGVKASNIAGSSVMSNNLTSVPYTTPGAPTLTSAIAGVNSMVLVWTAPVNNGSAPITGYLVFYGLSDAATQFDGMLPATTLTVNVTGLTNGTQYYFDIKAVNAAGNSPISNVLNATVIDVPDAPTDLTNIITSSQVTIAWTAPASDGFSTITGYLVYRGTSADNVTLIGNSTVATFVDTTVAAGSIYYYKVSAMNAAGEGAMSAAASITVPWPTLVPLSGTVVDAGGNGLVGITVALENGTSVQTDVQGKFTIMVSPGNHTLTISGPDIETKSVVVDVSGSGLEFGNITTSKASDNTMLILVVAIAIALVLAAVLLVMRNRKGKK